MGDLLQGKGYDVQCGVWVIVWGCDFLDGVVVLVLGSWVEIDVVLVVDGVLVLVLCDGVKFVGYIGVVEVLIDIFLCNNGLLICLVIDCLILVGGQDKVGIFDIVLELVLLVIIDCEDLVVCVDGEDKVLVYFNWLGLMDGMLLESVEKGGKIFICCLNLDVIFIGLDGGQVMVKGCLLMLVCNVGYLMIMFVILDCDGVEVYEGLMDVMVIMLCLLCDLVRGDSGNLVIGLIYVVKFKMYGLEEVVFVSEIFDFVEEVLGLLCNIVKLGIMDEECCISVNLVECICVVKYCVVFINMGFLDCIGDEYYILMEVGVMLVKGEMKVQLWIFVYEDCNVDIGLVCGLVGCVQIGKGMWVMFDCMVDMLV